MRVIICGGRGYAMTEADRDMLDSFHAAPGFTEVVSGGAHGADAGGEAWARSRGIEGR